MLINQKDLISRVRVRLNEDAYDSGMEEMTDQGRLTLDRIIASVLEPETRRIIAETEFTAGDDLVILAGPFSVAGEDCGTIRLPQDFMKLAELRLSSWKRPVLSVIVPEDPEFRRRNSPSAIVRGTSADPRIYLVRDSTGAFLELHPAGSGDTLLYGFYVADPVTSTVGTFRIPARCLDAVVSAIAERVRKMIIEN